MDKEHSREIVLGIEQGLHVRPAVEIVKCANGFESEISIIKDGQVADAKSAFSLMELAPDGGTRLTLRAVGPDSEEAVKALSILLEGK
ncbi:MAG: HPr family phosphocarrier protein [Planctomycetota bacterium]|nr:MAG: HPr family phosphocarrier protein [Planctomycetota bacterium]